MEKNKPLVSVILPAYNEEESLAEEIRKIRTALDGAKIPYEFIVIDDASTDRTSDVARKAGVTVLKHERNKGVGGARKPGIVAAKSEVIITSDADGPYPADPIPAMIEALKDQDMVVGARVAERGTF